MADNGTQPIAPPLDQLSQLLMSIPKAGSPAEGWAPPMALPSPQTSSTPVSSTQSGAVVSPQPATAAAPPIQTVSPTPPSDDPALASARAGMNSSQAALTKGLSDYSDTRGKMAAIPAVNPADYKPHWYDRLLGGLVGTAAGIGDPARGAKVGSDVTHRNLINAQNSRKSQIQPLLEQLNAEREEVPMLNAANESANRQVQSIQNDQKIAETSRKDKATEDLKSDLNDIRQQIAGNNLQKANDALEQKAKEFNTSADLKQQGLNNQAAMNDIRLQLGQMHNDLQQKKMEQDAELKNKGTDAKSLEDERKSRLTAIENDWKQHPYLNKIFGNKQKDIQAVNDDINTRLKTVGVATGATAGAPQAAGAPTPQTHSWSKSAWAKSHPGQDPSAAEAAARAQKYEVLP